MMWTNGWIWLIAALVLAAVELFIPGWAFMGLAAAVGIMGLLLVSGVWSAGLPLTLIVTALLSAVVWFALRRLIGGSKGDVRIWDRDIND